MPELIGTGEQGALTVRVLPGAVRQQVGDMGNHAVGARCPRHGRLQAPVALRERDLFVVAHGLVWKVENLTLI
jgi:hypothetical protein